MSEVTDELVEIERTKPKIKLDVPVIVGFQARLIISIFC